jgi:hypothetical protein
MPTSQRVSFDSSSEGQIDLFDGTRGFRVAEEALIRVRVAAQEPTHDPDASLSGKLRPFELT